MPCVIKFEYNDGVKLNPNEYVLWCGKKPTGFDWLFSDAQHAALADKPICNTCRTNIIKSLKGI